MKFLLHRDQGLAAIRDIGSRLRACGTGHHWIEKYHGDIFINVTDARDERILRDEFARLLDAVGDTKQTHALISRARRGQWTTKS